MTENLRSPVGDDMNRTMVATVGTFAAAIQPPEARDHYLVFVHGPQAGKRVQLGRKPMRIGRNAACDVVIADSRVSSQHSEISVKERQADALLTDLQSTNGTFVEGKRVQGSARLANGMTFQIGDQLLRHEYRSRSEVEQAQELQRDLDKANRYVQSLLPAPIRSGPVLTDWFFLPSTQLGGDAFGYHQLGEQTFAGYLLDISGHGVGAAMHSVSIMNVLRQRALPDTDFHDPAQVLRSLNNMFQMEQHDGMYFSMWYGVYDAGTRQLRYASAGHHASYLVGAARDTLAPLLTRNLVIGAMPGLEFKSDSVQVQPGSSLYVFSDGVFEVLTKTGTQWGLPDFLPLLQQPMAAEGGEAERLYRAVQSVARPGPLDDDFSMLVVTFL